MTQEVIEPRVNSQIDKSFLHIAGENFGAGVGLFSAIIGIAVVSEGSLPLAFAAGCGLVLFGALCVIRWAVDEGWLLIDAARHKREVDELRESGAYLVHELEDREEHIAALKRQLARYAKGDTVRGKPPSEPEPVWIVGEWEDPYAGALDHVFDDAKESGSVVDPDTEKSADAARRLVDHYEAYKTFARRSAVSQSNMTRDQWEKGADFLVACGAIRKSGKAYELKVPFEDVDPLIDEMVGERARKKSDNFVAA